MGSVQAAKTIGGLQPDEVVAAATKITVKADSSVIQLSGTGATVNNIYASGPVGRMLKVIGSADGSNDLDHNADTTTEGEMDIGSAATALSGPMDSMVLQMTEDRAWRMVRFTNL